MNTETVLSIGLIASDIDISENLSTLLGKNGVILKQQIQLEDLKPHHQQMTDLDVWLVDLAEDDWNDVLDLMLDEQTIPVFINEQQALSRQQHQEFWVKKLIVRLGELVLTEITIESRTNTQLSPQTREIETKTAVKVEPQPTQNTFPLWVLAASLGGPAALKRFLQALPEELHGSFILVQHIDHNFVPVLSKILEDYSSLRVKLPALACKVEVGEIILTPVNKRLTMTPTGMLLQVDGGWTPPYSPCIDDVLVDVASHWQNCGVIVFSGMGGDGLSGAKAMFDAGHPVWVQEPNSCANSTMPDEVEAAGYASFRGSPEQLAQQLVAQFHRQIRAAKTA